MCASYIEWEFVLEKDWVRVCWRAAWVARQLSITPLSCRFPGGPHDKKLNRIGQFSIKKLKLKDLIVRYISQSSTFVNSNSYLPVVRSAFVDCLRLTPLIARPKLFCYCCYFLSCECCRECVSRALAGERWQWLLPTRVTVFVQRAQQQKQQQQLLLLL